VIGQLEAEFLSRQLRAWVQLLDVLVVDEEVERPARDDQPLGGGWPVEDLVVASGLPEIGPADQLVADLELYELGRDREAVAPWRRRGREAGRPKAVR
jgi:hypothetical protein